MYESNGYNATRFLLILKVIKNTANNACKQTPFFYFCTMKRVKRFFITWARKLRHSGGHGIHSPFAFSFVMNVVYNPYPYYFFTDSKKEGLSKKERKTGELLFRLTERYRLSTIVAIGNQSTHLTHYVTASSNKIKLFYVESVKASIKEIEKELSLCPVLFLFDDSATKNEWLGFYERIKALIPENSVIVVPDIQENSEKKAFWDEFYQNQPTGALFDLYDTGIIFLKKELHKKRYIVSF